MKKSVIFLNRAYNDLDIQLPLIRAFAMDGRFAVKVVTYPCDGEIYISRTHEAASYIAQKHGVRYENMLDHPSAPLVLKIFSALQYWVAMRQSRAQNTLYLKIFNRLIRQGLRRLLQKPQDWLKQAAKDWNGALVVLDEVLCQPDRSPVIDEILPDLATKGAVHLHTILTGHRIYKDVNPTGQKPPPYRKTQSAGFLVPNPLNKGIYHTLFPHENVIQSGNVRMDTDWIKTLHTSALKPPYYASAPFQKLPRDQSIKIVFMLSKLNYGVEVDHLTQTLKILGQMGGVTCAVKPHTRGMKFDFMTRSEQGRLIDVYDIPSPLLIEWADLVLFTGSSIVFHALLAQKAVGFLKYCQNLPTVFDETEALLRYESVTALVDHIAEVKKTGAPFMSDAHFQKAQEWLLHEVHNDIASGLTASYAKDLILRNTGYEEDQAA